jgi:hypothetical protein
MADEVVTLKGLNFSKQQIFPSWIGTNLPQYFFNNLLNPIQGSVLSAATFP